MTDWMDMTKQNKTRASDMTTPPPQPNPHYTPQWTEWTRHLTVILLLIGAVVAVMLLRPVFGILILALLIAFVMYRPARYLSRRRMLSYGGAVALSYAVLLVVIFLVLMLSTPVLLDQAAALWSGVERGFANVQTALADYTPDQGITEVFGARIDFNFAIEPVREFLLAEPAADGEASSLALDVRQLLDNALQFGTTLTQALAATVTSITGFFSTVLLAVFVSFLFLMDLPRTEKTVTDWLPESYYREYALLVDKIDNVWSGFFRGQVFIGIIIGVLTGIQLAVMGISNAAVLAVITGVISLIPTIGGFIALVPLSIVPLFNGSTLYPDASGLSVALSVVLINLVISQVIWNVIAPKIMGDALNLPLPVVILGVFVGASVGGILGAFLASPVIASLQVAMIYLLRKVTQQDPFPGEHAPFVVGQGWLARIVNEQAAARMVRQRKLARGITRIKSKDS
jgi:predicted PurR-regulated permease PerM